VAELFKAEEDASMTGCIRDDLNWLIVSEGGISWILPAYPARSR
jgi:hypothetical protein